jgi:hypothetical protein
MQRRGVAVESGERGQLRLGGKDLREGITIQDLRNGFVWGRLGGW